ncbi:hypothetical protein BDZ91DRAFT_797758 [Kalaharituber pfeilii]|nr:hypothetical protein BDZ91DRAFT_797758 [Kalaharituber pfeilii]
MDELTDGNEETESCGDLVKGKKFTGPKGRWIVTGSPKIPGYWCQDKDAMRRWFKYSNGSKWKKVLDYRGIALTAVEAETPCGSLTPDELHNKLKHFWETLIAYDPIWANEVYILPKASSMEKLPGAASMDLYTTWIQYFIQANHHFGFAHALAGALLTRDEGVPTSFKFHPELFVSSLSCLVKDERAGWIRKDSSNGDVIPMEGDENSARRVWDLCSHKVIGYPITNLDLAFMSEFGQCHTVGQRQLTGNTFGLLRITLNGQFQSPKEYHWKVSAGNSLLFGCRYAWLDVLCLRQEYPRHLLYEKHQPAEWAEHERRRLEEWKPMFQL